MTSDTALRGAKIARRASGFDGRGPYWLAWGCGSSSLAAQGGPGGFCDRHGKSYLTRRRRGGEGGGGGLLTGRAIPSAYRWAWCRWYSRVVEVPVRIEVAAGFVAPGASEPPRLQPSWPPGRRGSSSGTARGAGGRRAGGRRSSGRGAGRRGCAWWRPVQRPLSRLLSLDYVIERPAAPWLATEGRDRKRGPHVGARSMPGCGRGSRKLDAPSRWWSWAGTWSVWRRLSG